jgi:hypothetical protein
MWGLLLSAMATAAEVTVAAGVQDGASPEAWLDSARVSAGVRLKPALAVSVDGGFAFDPEPPIASSVASWRSLWHAAALVDVGFGGPDERRWTGGPHVMAGPTLHSRQYVFSDRLVPAQDLLGSSAVHAGGAFGASLDVWYGRAGARLSVVDHVLLEDDRAQSVVNFGLDLRARFE